MRVLVVDDHPQFRATLANALSLRGHDVVGVDSADRAKSAWQQNRFPLVFLDRSLAGDDGLDVCRRLRHDEYGRSSVIVIMTGSIDPLDVADFLSAGADDYISKLLPWDQIEIRFAFAEQRAMSVIDRWETQDALKETDARFRSFMDNAPALAWIKDAQGRFVYHNNAFAQTFAVSTNADASISDASLWPEAANALHVNDRRVLETGRPIQVIEDLPDHDGSTHHWLTTKFPLLDAAGTDCVGGMAVDITDRIRTEQELVSERELLQTIMDHVPDFLYVKDRSSRFVRMNTATAQFLGLEDPSDGIGKSDLDFFPEDLALQYFMDEQTVMASGVPQLNRLEPQDAEHTLWSLTSTVPIAAADGTVRGIVGVARDVTDRRHMEELIRRSDERQRALITAIPDLIVRFDREGVLLDLKGDQAQRLIRTADEMVGKRLHDLLAPDQAAIAVQAAHRALAARHLEIVELGVHTKGELRRLEARIIPSGDDELLMIGRDVTDQRVLEDRLAFQASHDSLTQLPNRARFGSQLDHALTNAQPPAHRVALLFIDLNGFKAVNDQFGHAAGDHLLVELSCRLQTFASDAVTVARLGGDEFAVLITNTALARAPDEMATCIQMDLSRSVWIEGFEIRPSLSIGIATGEAGAITPSALLREADSAMYQAKQSMTERPVEHASHTGPECSKTGRTFPLR
jgi:diguanylate cyclase (GGDEF)-like protein/PAS domain S-box-containing protein